MTSIRIRVILLFIILACIFVGVLIYQARTSTPEQASSNTAEEPIVPMNLGNVVGTVTSISGDTLTITTREFAGDTTDAGNSEREVSVSSETKILRLSYEDTTKEAPSEAVSLEEGVPFLVRPQMGTSTDATEYIPTPLVRTKVSFADIKVGEMVNIVVDRKRLSEKQFIAETIEILPAPEVFQGGEANQAGTPTVD